MLSLPFCKASLPISVPNTLEATIFTTKISSLNQGMSRGLVQAIS